MARRATTAEVAVPPLARGRRPTTRAIMRGAVASSCLRRSGVPAPRAAMRARRASRRRGPPQVLRPNRTAITPSRQKSSGYRTSRKECLQRGPAGPRRPRHGPSRSRTWASRSRRCHRGAHGSEGQTSVPSAPEVRSCDSPAPTRCDGGRTSFSPRPTRS